MDNATRILIVEDRLTDYELAQHEIHRSLPECILERVETREDYLAALESYQPHLILSDYFLPRFDGITALKLAREFSPLTPLIIWTGSISEDVAVECMKAGAANYVVKENPRRLVPAILHALDERRLLTEHRQAQDTILNLSRFPEEDPNPVLRVTRDGAILFANPSSQLLLEQWHTTIGGILPEEWKQIVDDSFANNQKRSMDIAAQGRVFSIMVVPIREAGYVNLYGSDITERKLAEERIVESERRFRALVENAMDNISILDKDGLLLWGTPSVNRTLGYELNTLLNRNLLDFIHPEDLDRTSHLFDSVVAEPGGQKHDSFRMMHQNGSWRWIEATYTNMLDEAGVQAIVVNHRDVTERKNFEEDLLRSEERYRFLFENNPLPMWLYDLETLKFVKVNDAAIENYGYSLDEFMSMTIKDIRPQDDVDKLLKHLAHNPVQEKGIGRAGIWRHRKKDGSLFFVDIVSHQMEFEGRKVELILALDVTQRYEAEIEIKKKNDDLALINRLNEVINRGQGLDAVVRLLKQELHRMLGCDDVTIYLLGPDGKTLNMQQHTLPPEISQKVERLIGRPIPNIEIPIQEGGYFHEVMLAKRGRITNDPLVIQKWMGEFIETSFLPPIARGPIRKLLPGIFKLLNIKSTMLIPLIWEGRTIGMLDVSGPRIFSPEDLQRLENLAGQLTTAIRRNQTEDALRLENERFARFANSNIVGITIAEPTGRITFANEYYLNLLGVTRQDFLEGKVDWRKCTPSEWLPADEKAIVQLRSHGISEPYEKEYEQANGTRVPIYMANAMLPGPGEQIVSFILDITEQKRVEEKLNLSHSLLYATLESTVDGILVVGSDGKIANFNQKFLELWRIPSEIIAQKEDRILLEHVLDQLKDPSAFIAKVEALYRSPEETSWDELEFRDGRVFERFSQPQRLGDSIVGRVWSFRDVTDYKQAEKVLRASEERFSNAFEFAPIGMALVSLEGRFLKVNKSLSDIVGYAKGELVTKTFQEITFHEDLDTDINYVRQVLAGEINSYQLEKRYIHKSGHLVWVLLGVSLVKDHEGEPQYFISQIKDITERKRTENELRASEERFRQLATHIEEVFWMTDVHTGQEIYLSPAVETIWGRTVSYMMNTPNAFFDSVLVEDRTLISEYMEKQRKGEKTEMEYRILRPDGSVRWIWDRAFPGFDETGDVILLTGIAADITERKKAENEMRRHLTELEALYENGLTVGQLLEPREIGNHIINTFAQYLSWHHVTIRLLNPETDELQLIAFNQPGLSAEARSEMEVIFSRRVARVGQGLSGRVMLTGEALRTGNVHTYSDYVDIHEGIMSGLYMPLKVGGRTIGCISVESGQPDAFTVEDERLLSTFGNQAAITLENARLYQAAQREISERRRAQNALWASESHYRQLADSITDILFELDQDLRYTHWNKASEMFSGIPASDVIGKSISEVWKELGTITRLEDVYRTVLRDRQVNTFEIEIVIKGRKYFLEIRAYPSTRGVSVVARDITERKLLEILQQKRFELIDYSAHHSRDNVLQKVVDDFCQITESHIGFLHFVEEDGSTIKLQTWSRETIEIFCHIEGAGLHYPLTQAGVWADAVRQHRPVIHNDYTSIPERKGLPEGHVNVIREMVVPIVRSDQVVAIIGVGNKEMEYTELDIDMVERFADYAWDITERRRIEDELAEERNQLALRVEERTAALSRANSNLARALRVKDEFLANMSHELRTPLNAILGLSESLSEQVAGPLNEKQEKYLGTINESGHHLLSLINDILDLAKIEAGQLTLDITTVDINSVCQAGMRMVKQLSQRKNQDVRVEIDPTIGLMWADERRLKQMIVNLLSNAVKFTPESGSLGLEVHGDKEENKVSITVWDQGIGISENNLPLLFKPFVQLDSGLARESSGTGLGLVLVAQMAQMHGGSVSVQSQPGKGSRFTILLPWEPATVGESEARLRTTGKFPAIKPGEKRPTILLVEDTREVVMMLVDYLEMAGFNMVAAQDGVDGLTQAKIAHPDLILMDIQMPRMDGFETTKKLRSDPEFKETPIIALTALAMPNDRQRCIEAGMNEYLSKPVNLKALVKLIRTFLYGTEGK